MMPISLQFAPQSSAGPPPGPPPKEPEGFALWLAASGPPPGQLMQTGEALRPQPIAGEEELDSRSAETDPEAAAMASQAQQAWTPVPSANLRLDGFSRAIQLPVGRFKDAPVAGFPASGPASPQQSFAEGIRKFTDPVKAARFMSLGSLVGPQNSAVTMGEAKPFAPPAEAVGQAETGAQDSKKADAADSRGRSAEGAPPVTEQEAPISRLPGESIFRGRREMGSAPIQGREIPIGMPQDQPLFMGRREMTDAPIGEKGALTGQLADQPLFMGRREMGDAPAPAPKTEAPKEGSTPLFMGRREMTDALITGREIPLGQLKDQPLFMGRREMSPATTAGTISPELPGVEIKEGSASPPSASSQATRTQAEPQTGTSVSVDKAVLGTAIAQPSEMPQQEGGRGMDFAPNSVTSPKTAVTSQSASPEPAGKLMPEPDSTEKPDQKDRNHLLHGLKSGHAQQAEPATAQSGSQDQPKDDGQRRLEAMRQAADIIQARQPMRMAVEIDRMDLGLIKLEMSHDRANEAVEASFEARRPETRDALMMAQPDLRRALDEKGISLSRFDVSAETGQGSPQREGRSAESGRQASPQTLTANAVEAPVSRSSSRHAGLEVIA